MSPHPFPEHPTPEAMPQQRLNSVATRLVFLGFFGLITLANPSEAYGSSTSPLQSGSSISINGREVALPWSLWQNSSNSTRSAIALSDLGLMQNMGVELLNTDTSKVQPIHWFSPNNTPSLNLPTFHYQQRRYLDITELAQQGDWQVSLEQNRLKISTPPTQILAIQSEFLTQSNQYSSNSTFKPQQITLQLDRPAIWQTPTFIPQPRPVAPTPSPLTGKMPVPQQTPAPPLLPDDPNQPSQNTPKQPTEPPPPQLQDWVLTVDAQLSANVKNTVQSLSQQNYNFPEIEQVNQQSRLKLKVPPGWRPVISTSAKNPAEIRIYIKPDFLIERNILWASGLRWRQQYIQIPETSNQPQQGILQDLLGGVNPQTSQPSMARFPVVWLELDLKLQGLRLKPILGSLTSRVGVQSLINMAENYQVSAAINGGFFNRINQLPLGAIRQGGNWLSSPILNRGAIAWTEQGQVQMDRLTLQETLITSTNQRLPILYLNSGYAESGIARYTRDWGESYSRIQAQETIVIVEDNTIRQVLTPSPTPDDKKTAIPIPTQGYLLVLRSQPGLEQILSVGTQLQIQSQTIPSNFNSFPQILGAGPLLLQNGTVVLDAKAEKFSDAFNQQKAVRSAIARTADQKLLIVAVHNRPDGSGPSLAELAQLMQKLGAVDALNLDGGSSTGLYLGGYLLDRPPQTAAPVHNGLGIVLPF